ncbi:MAG: IS110 family transposase [Chloroflexota bacterium]
MRTIGIELAVAGAHKAIVADDQGHFVTRPLSFFPRAGDLNDLLARARHGATSPELQAVMEPTGMAWFPVAVYLNRQQVPVYLVNGQQVADLRRFYKKHAKCDRVDARILATLPRVNPDGLHRLRLPDAPTLACQRGCRELDRLTSQITAISNRLQAMDRFAWPGLHDLVFPDHLSPAARWFREHWYDPQQVLAAGAATIRQQWLHSRDDPRDAGDWVEPLVCLAHQVVALYGSDGTALDFALLQTEICRQQAELAVLERHHRTVRLKVVHRLYRQIHPSRNLETLKGVGQDSAAVYASLIGDPERFPSTALFRGWTGLVPDSKQSSGSETKGLHITKAGPDLIKKYAYLDADVARRWDPQIAAIYYDQMVHKGKHHTQAVCACATHLMDRVFAVLRDGQPYEPRDVDGTPVEWQEALTIIAERYTVPEEVRRRTTKGARRARADRQAEREQKRESSPR